VSDSLDESVRYVFATADYEIPVSGMTTVCRDEGLAMAARLGLGDNGFAEITAVVLRIPDDGVHRSSLAVTYEGSTVGYLHHGWPGSEDLDVGSGFEAPMQVYTRQGREVLKIAGTVWCGTGDPQWRHSEESRIPMNAAEEAAAGLKTAMARLERYAAEGVDIFEAVRSGTAQDGAYVSINRLIYQAVSEGRIEEGLLLAQLTIQGLASRSVPGPMSTPTAQAAARVLKAAKMPREELWVIEWWQSVADPADQPAYPLGKRGDALRKQGHIAQRPAGISSAVPAIEG
jgi:hypothetical protein